MMTNQQFLLLTNRSYTDLMTLVTQTINENIFWSLNVKSKKKKKLLHNFIDLKLNMYVVYKIKSNSFHPIQKKINNFDL